MRRKAQPGESSPAAGAAGDGFCSPDLRALLESLYAESGAECWKLSLAQFASALERSARNSATASAAGVAEYLRALHVRDLALASGCAHGCEAAWEHFIGAYRGYLRAAAGAILRCAADSPAAQELADSLFAELYGMGEQRGAERSLFRYFHGRSSLKTWLRAVLAQRHIDKVRATRRQVDLDDEEAERVRETPALAMAVEPPDPHRERYVRLFRRALETALGGLEAGDLERLRCYYAEEQTLATIGQRLGEHESSVSRSLERIRRTLREKVEALLRNGCAVANGSAAQAGLSDAEIALCLAYAGEDPPIDLDQLLAPGKVKAGSAAKQRKAVELPE
jgi:RNA polymerase sigma factor (sigma-70 family)